MKLDADELRAAVAAARAAGWTLKRRETLNVVERCLCPLGALALQSDDSIADLGETANEVSMAAHVLDISTSEANAFASGFDGCTPTEFEASKRHPGLHALGAQLAAEMLP